MTVSRRQMIAAVAVGTTAGPLTTAVAAQPRIRWAQGWLLWRDVKGQTLQQAIDDLHAVGADGIEYSPRDGEPDKFGLTREALLGYLRERGMAVSGMYFGTPGMDPARKDDMVAAARKRIELVAAFGAKNLVIGPPETPPGTSAIDRRDAISRLAPIYNEIGRIAGEHGVQAGLHPHLNTLIEAADEVDLAMNATDPRHVFLSADTGHLFLANGDVLSLLRKHRKRLNYFHFKDGFRPASRPDFTPSLRELGRGAIDFPAIMTLLRELRYTGWINVELDRSTSPPRQAAETSFAYVKERLKPIYT